MERNKDKRKQRELKREMRKEYIYNSEEVKQKCVKIKPKMSF